MLTRRDFLKVTAASGAMLAVGDVSAARNGLHRSLPDETFAHENERQIAVLTDVDVMVVGGSSRAVAAAVAAAHCGCSVFLMAEMPYLGDDICGSFLYDRQDSEQVLTDLAEKLFTEKHFPTPLQTKKVLEDALIDAGVDFLYSSYATNVLTDATNCVRGVVIANRSGRQAIRAKVVIDATHTASVARAAGARFSDFRPGKQEFTFTSVGKRSDVADTSVKVVTLPQTFQTGGKGYEVTRYTLTEELHDDSYASLMRVEQKLRSLAWNPDQVDSSDLLWYVPQCTIKARTTCESGTAVRGVSIDALQPENTKGLYVLGPCASMSREDADRLFRPVTALTLGSLMGERVAEVAKQLTSDTTSLMVRQNRMDAFDYGRVGEVLKPLRVRERQEYVDCGHGALPILGRYDVVVLGGGTAGATAGISAAQHGASTLVMDYLHGLGGISTMGLIGVYWDGFREGYTKTIDAGVRGMAPENHPRQQKKDSGVFQTDWKQEWYRRELLKQGGELWYGVLGCGAVVDGNTVKGVVVCTPFGRGVVLSKVLIDSTGSADIAIAAGADFDYTGKKTLAIQGAGMGKRDPGNFSENNDWLFIDDSDIMDVSRVYVQAKRKFEGHYDIVKLPQTRERRRVVGDHVISVYDVLNHRRYTDTISYHKSSFDTHGMIVDPFFILSPPMARHTIYDADVPLRALLPRGLEGIMTTGLGASAHRDAMPVIRMQPCLQNQGFAVGYLSAVAVKEGKSLRKVDMKKIQRYLVAMGNLPERVLTDKNFRGFTDREMKAAAVSVADDYKGLEVLLTDTARCKKLVGERMQSATSADAKVVYASILCMLGDATYSKVLAERIAQYAEWDKGWHYTGMHQFGMCLSRLDSYIMALGRSKDASQLSVVLEKAGLLQPEDYFSHFRAVAMAAEEMGSGEATDVLYALLMTPGMRFHSVNSYAEARSQIVPNNIDVTFRNKALKELHVARALYMCGDKNDLGKKVLQRYADSLQGHYARYATELLAL